MSQILLVEDEERIAQSLALTLEAIGHNLTHCATLAEAETVFDDRLFAAILLDLNLPDGNGIDFCRSIRQQSAIPILMLTARRDEVDRILGLELGADDYIVKPFSPREVAARINAVLRRRCWERAELADAESEKILNCGGVTLNQTRREVLVEEKTVHLTRTEYRLLQTLMEHPHQVYTRQVLVDAVWEGTFVDDRVVDAVVSRIRRKLGRDAAGRPRIRTLHGIGYKMEC
jgi:two-component system response regulator BaeR